MNNQQELSQLARIDTWARSSVKRRTLVFLALAWAVVCVGYAMFQAYQEEIPLYRPAILLLVCIGAPCAVFFVYYATSLLSRKAKLFAALALLGCLLGGATLSYIEVKNERQESEAFSMKLRDMWAREDAAISQHYESCATSLRTLSEVAACINSRAGTSVTPEQVRATIKNQGR